MENILFECAALSVDVLLFGICYRYYRIKYHSASAVQDAPCFEINSNLYSKLKEKDNCIPYAVVTGVVKSTSNALRSQYLPNIKAVIREKVTKERKVRWSPVLRIWNTVEHDIQRFENTVPFCLVGDGRWFKSSIEIIDPLVAEELTLTTVYDHFTSHEDTIGEVVAGWFRGERTTGIQEIENMLTEGSVLTGVGELVIENNAIKMKPPSARFTYFLTTMSLESLIKKLKEESKLFKSLSILLGCVGVFLVSNIILKLYRIHKERVEVAKQRLRHMEARRQRRLADPTREVDNSENRRLPTCVICLTRPVEIVILECGHACLCLDCSELVRDYCPVCRSPIERAVPAYLP